MVLGAKTDDVGVVVIVDLGVICAQHPSCGVDDEQPDEDGPLEPTPANRVEDERKHRCRRIESKGRHDELQGGVIAIGNWRDLAIDYSSLDSEGEECGGGKEVVCCTSQSLINATDDARLDSFR